jgi:hypothetical protein
MRQIFKTEEKRQTFFLGVGLKDERREPEAERYSEAGA